MANGLCEVVILRYVRCQKKQGRRIEKMGLEEQCLYVDTCAMNSEGEDDARVLKKKVVLVTEAHTECLVLVAILIVVPLLPEDTDANEMLFEFVGAPQVRAGKKAEAAGVYLEGLVDRKFHGEVSHGVAVLLCGSVGERSEERR